MNARTVEERFNVIEFIIRQAAEQCGFSVECVVLRDKDSGEVWEG